MSELFLVSEFPVLRSESSDDAYYRKHLVTGGSNFMEFQAGDKAFLWREFEKHIGAIDSELLRLIREWYPTTASLIKFLTSVGAYPNKAKIRALKEALTAPNRHSDENFMRITKILLGEVHYVPSAMQLHAYGVPVAHELFFEEPFDPEAEGVTRKGIGFERDRRQYWRKAWTDYLADLKRRSGVPVPFEFLCDLPTDSRALIKISPYLRLPSGEYLAPIGEDVKPPASGSGNVKPIAEEKKDEKAEEKKFPWWIVVVIAAVALFFIMKNK